MTSSEIAALATRASDQARSALDLIQRGDFVGAQVMLLSANASLGNLNAAMEETRPVRKGGLLSLVDEETPEPDPDLPEWMSRRYGDEP